MYARLTAIFVCFPWPFNTKTLLYEALTPSPVKVKNLGELQSPARPPLLPPCMYDPFQTLSLPPSSPCLSSPKMVRCASVYKALPVMSPTTLRYVSSTKGQACYGDFVGLWLGMPCKLFYTAKAIPGSRHLTCRSCRLYKHRPSATASLLMQRPA